MYIFSTQIKDFMGMGVPGHLPPDAVVPSEFMEKVRNRGVLWQEGRWTGATGVSGEQGGTLLARSHGEGWEGSCVEHVSKGRGKGVRWFDCGLKVEGKYCWEERTLVRDGCADRFG